MTGSDSRPADPSRLHQAVVEYLLAQDGGQPLNSEDLLARYPDVAEELREYLKAVSFVASETTKVSKPAEVNEPSTEPSDFRPASDLKNAPCGDTKTRGSWFRPPVESLAPEFVDLELINRGGMGVIYKARQAGLKRIVALKFILLGRWASAQDQQRFQVEAQVLARLRHPGIAAVFSSGEVDGHPYLVMEFIDGCSLRDLIMEAPLSADRAAQITRDAAAAIAEAHRNGVLHRDLKPSNILIDMHGRPHVTDFGLAKVLTDPDDLTATGEIIGTPCFMSPEQARGERDIGTASDIYSLGAVLYASLTGNPPFRGTSSTQTLLMVESSEPPPPRLFVPSIPRDLETICLKCLQKKPGARFSTVAEMADDLDRFLNRKPILARPIGRIEHCRRWIVNNPTVSVATGLLVLLLIAAAAGLMIHSSVVSQLNTKLVDRNDRLQATLRNSDRLRQLERDARIRSQRIAYASDMRRAIEAWYSDDTRQVSHLLAAHLPDSSGTDLRCFAWRYLNRMIPRQQTLFEKTGDACYHVTFSPDGTRCAVSCADGHVRIVAFPAGHLIADWDTGQSEVNAAAFSPDGSLLATAGDDGCVRLWAWPTLKEITTLRIFDNLRVFGVAFTPAGDFLLACGESTAVSILDTHSWEQRGSLSGGHELAVEALAISPDGRSVATAGRDGRMLLWDLESRTPRYEPSTHATPLSSVVFLPKSDAALFGALDGHLLVLSAETGVHDPILRRPDGIQQLAVADDGLVALTDRGGSVMLCGLNRDASGRIRSAERVCSWQADGNRIYGASFAADGQKLITSSSSGSVSSWNVNISPAVIHFGDGHAQHADHGQAVCRLTEGEVLICGPDALRRWSPATQESSVVIRTVNRLVSCDVVRVTAGRSDDLRITAVEMPNVVHTVDPTGSARQWTIGSADDSIADIRLLPHSNAAMILRKSGLVSQVDLNSGTVVREYSKSNAMTVVDTPTGAWLAERGTGNGLLQFDLSEWRPARRFSGHPDSIRALALSPDRSRIASTGNDRSVAVWNTSTGEQIHRNASLPTDGTGLDWSPDGRTLAVCCDDGSVRLFQAATLRELGIWTADPDRTAPADPIYSVCFTSDGQWLIAVDSRLRVSAFDGRPSESRSY